MSQLNQKGQFSPAEQQICVVGFPTVDTDSIINFRRSSRPPSQLVLRHARKDRVQKRGKALLLGFGREEKCTQMIGDLRQQTPVACQIKPENGWSLREVSSARSESALSDKVVLWMVLIGLWVRNHKGRIRDPDTQVRGSSVFGREHFWVSR